MLGYVCIQKMVFICFFSFLYIYNLVGHIRIYLCFHLCHFGYVRQYRMGYVPRKMMSCVKKSIKYFSSVFSMLFSTKRNLARCLTRKCYLFSPEEILTLAVRGDAIQTEAGL